MRPTTTGAWRRLPATRITLSAITSLALFAIMATSIARADVWTDRELYFPGETVTISGNGMLPGEDVRIDVNLPDDYPGERLDQSTIVQATEDGTLTETYVTPGSDAPVEGWYEVIAVGQTSGSIYTTRFFDPVTAADITNKADDCSRNQTIFDLGEDVCVSVLWTTNAGAPTRTLRINWYDPGDHPSGVPTWSIDSLKPLSSSETDTDRRTLTVAGIWTVETCQADNDGGACTAIRDTATFTVTVTVTAAPTIRATTTTLDCVPTSVAIYQPTTCTVTVEDTADGTPVTPSGSVGFTSDATASLSNNQCALSETVLGTATCNITYTPEVVTTHTITATYGANDDHDGSSNTGQVEATKRTTTSTVNCAPTTVAVNAPSQCTITLMDTSPDTAQVLTGSATASSDNVSGAFSNPGDTCLLDSGNCTVDYTPRAAGAHNISASYAETLTHLGSNTAEASTNTATLRATTTTVDCDPDSLAVNAPTTCTITVADTEGEGHGITPFGAVTLDDGSSTGVFSNNTCGSLDSDGKCTVTYTPDAAGGHTITGTFSANSVHEGSNGNDTVNSTLRATTTTVECPTSLVEINTSVTCTVTVADTEGDGNELSPADTITLNVGGSGCLLDPNGDNTSRSCDATFTKAAAGVFYVIANYPGNNVHGESESPDETVMVVFYDPSAGFVTGGGWIESPEGACQLTEACESLTGRANFGFVSQYQRRGQNLVLSGNIQFVFQTGGLNFHNDSYDWLVVAGQDKAKYKGTGTVNGLAGYGFMVTDVDRGKDGVDTFRIKIWDANGDVVYDNQMGISDEDYDGTAISGGSIVDHTGGNWNAGGGKEN